MHERGIIAWLVIGCIAGWASGLIVKGGGFGLVGDVLVGVAGAVIGGFIATLLHINVGGGFVASVVTATIGAALLLFVIRVMRRA